MQSVAEALRARHCISRGLLLEIVFNCIYAFISERHLLSLSRSFYDPLSPLFASNPSEAIHLLLKCRFLKLPYLKKMCGYVISTSMGGC